jgi:hypothetical protein
MKGGILALNKPIFCSLTDLENPAYKNLRHCSDSWSFDFSMNIPI